MRRFDDKMNRQMSSLDASLLRRSWAITLTLANPSPNPNPEPDPTPNPTPNPDPNPDPNP
jgi:hypothetical protein